MILLASSVIGLQKMVNKLEEYCTTWGLELNLAKSKIMVFRNGGKPSAKEKWHYGGKCIDVVNRFRYLGVLLTPTLTFNPHLQDKSSAAKLAIATMWKQFMSRPNISFKEKIKVFNAVGRTILCYSAQVWGYVNSDWVESVARYFIKMVFSLPRNTPNYMLFLESQMRPLYLHTLRLHFNYIHKVLKLPTNRLPNYLAKKCIELNVYWAKEWESLRGKYSITLCKNEDLKEWKRLIEDSIETISAAMHAEFEQKALSSRSYPQYVALRSESDVIPLDQVDNFQSRRWLLKVRCDLLALKFRPYDAGNQKCDLCSSGEIENAFHFIGKCRALCSVRRRYLGRSEFSWEEYLKLIKGVDLSLVKYCTVAWELRFKTMVEYGFN